MVIPATKRDISQILELINNESKYLLKRTEQEIESLLDNFVVIKDKEIVVACAVFEEYAPKIAEIRSLVVAPEYRKHGYGQLLIEHLLKRAKPGQEVFVVTSKVHFFKKLGFDSCLNEKQILFFQK